jgi:D-alanyl-D-alanine-carboxypeptidase/D-alanyl-D-alanine-endopeptidase
MAAQLATRRSGIGKKDWSAALAWDVKVTPQQEVVWHNGGTGGYRTSMGFDPRGRRGGGVDQFGDALWRR